jgi:hypothetical protein
VCVRVYVSACVYVDMQEGLSVPVCV